MKVVILAGGFGTRLSEETQNLPKPMVEIGGKPILWHIMKIYSHYGFNDFIICLGYKGYIIKEYFKNYFIHNSDITVSLKNNNLEVHNNPGEDWKVTLVDTGLETATGGRIKRVRKFIGDDNFMLTYGDGVANIDINKLVSFHNQHKRLATVTAVKPEKRFGVLKIRDNLVEYFGEKMDAKDSWINGGFFVLSPKVIDYIEGDDTCWEKEPLETLAKEKQLMAYYHDDFWKPVDKLSDKRILEEMWNSGRALWKIWEE